MPSAYDIVRKHFGIQVAGGYVLPDPEQIIMDLCEFVDEVDPSRVGDDITFSNLECFLNERVEKALYAEQDALEDPPAAGDKAKQPPDFDTSHLTGQARTIADSIVVFLTKRLGQAPYGGGCKAFYSVEEWTERREDYGCSSLLILCHDGGDLAAFCNYDYEQYKAMEALREHLDTLGVYVEQATSWYSAIYTK